MTLIARISDLATRVATEIKSVRTLVNGNAADLSGLPTTNKTNIVAALTELHGAINAASSISDGATGTGTTWSSQKIQDTITAAISALTSGAPGALDTLDELAAALGDDANFATTVTTALANRVRVDATQTLTGPQQAQARSNIGAGTSNLVIGTTAGTAADAAATTSALAGKASSTHSHTASQISDATTTGRALVTTTDAAAARSTLSVYSQAEIGNPETNLVTLFEAGLL